MAGATIYDVATAAGVSIKTVSRVVNGEPNVSSALKSRVDKAVADLGYRRSLSARSLAGASSSIIAALVDADLTIEHWRSGRGNDYLSRLELGALMEVRRVDHHLMVELVDHASPTLERDLSALLASIRPAGVLLTPPNSDNTLVLDILDGAGVAFARIGSKKDLHRGINVAMDERGAARDMTVHLIELGHRRIGFITGPVAYAASQRRLQGFRDAMAEHDLAIAEGSIAEGDFTFPSGITGAQRIFNDVKDVTAIFASNDDTAFGALQAARTRGMTVPDDLSIAGFDDTPSALFSSPALTTIRQPVAEMAAMATRRLIPALSTGPSAEEADGVVMVPYALVVRASTGAPPAPR